MDDAGVKRLVEDALARSSGDAGFLGADVRSELDFDGEPVISVVARYRKRPSIDPDPLISAVNVIRTTLIAAGEDRSVLLENEIEAENAAERELAEEDVD